MVTKLYCIYATEWISFPEDQEQASSFSFFDLLALATHAVISHNGK